MTVKAFYFSPSTKEFEVVSQTGSKMILDRVFKKLLKAEKEAAAPQARDQSLLNRSNYFFKLVGYEPNGENAEYVLEVTPKVKTQFLYRGMIWVDATDFAVARIEAEPAQIPFFWTKKNEIHPEYARVQGFWLPVRNQATSLIRLGGRAMLTIDYSNYSVNGTGDPSSN